MDNEKHIPGFGLAIAAFVISIINVLLVGALAYVTIFSPLEIPTEGEKVIKVTISGDAISGLSAEKEALTEEAELSSTEKDMIYQAMRGTVVAKEKKINRGREEAKMVWTAVREYYNNYGQYPPAAKDIFGTGSFSPGVKVSQPPGEPYFKYNILSEGSVSAVPNTSVDPSLGDVSNIIVSTDGIVRGGNY